MNTFRLCAALLALTASSFAQEATAAPDFTLKDTTGKEHTLSALKDKTVVLEWTNKNCPYVVRHYEKGGMQGLANEWTQKGIVWLAIDTTHSAKADEVEAWRSANKIGQPVLLDPTGATGRAYRATHTPHLFVIHKGQIVYQGAIDDDRDGKKTERVNYVAQALTELAAGKAVSVPSTKAYGCTVKYAPKTEEAKPANDMKSKLGVWMTDAAMAKEISKATGKPILMDFTGSDWCGWCIRLKAEVFHKPEFETWAKENAVLLTLDFPRKTTLDPKLVEQNKALKDQYGIRGYPTIVFTDHTGKELGRSGYRQGGPDAWIEHAKSVLATKP